MKQLLPIVLFLQAALTHAQNKDAPVLINLDEYEASRKIALPFKAIQILDVRFDKSNIGCVNKTVSLNSFKRHKTTAVLPDSLHPYLPQLLDKLVTCSSESNDTLIVLVKQFRTVEQIFNGINLLYEPKLLLKLSASLYKMENNRLVKLFSLDETFSEKWPIDQRLKKDRMTEFRAEAFVKIVQAIFDKRTWLPSGVGFQLDAVHEGIRRRFSLPLFTDTSLHRGVYKDFQEFKQNKPSLTNVEMKMRNGKIVVIKDANGMSIKLENFWGACDGEKRYIIFRKELCELLPTDKSFRFLSYSQTSDLSGQPSYGDYATQNGLLGAALMKAMDNTVNREYFYLNMDEETVYLEEIFGKSSLKSMQKELLK